MALTKVKASNITLSTPAANSNDTTIATTEYVTTALANLVDSAPSTLNTLNELADALGDDANFSTTVTNSIATKLPLAGGDLTGRITITASDPGNNVSRLLDIKDSTAMAADVGGGISFFGKYQGASYSTFGQIIGAKTNATSGDYSGYLAFKTRSSSALPTERMRIDSSGNVGIGTDAADGMLHVKGTTNKTIKLDPTFSSGTYTSLAFARNGTDKWRVFQDGSDGYLSFYNDVASNYQLSLAGNGRMFMNVPPANFNSYSNANLGHLLVQQPADNVGIGVIDDAETNTFKMINNGTEAKIAYNAALPIRFYTSDSTLQFEIPSSGGLKSSSGGMVLQTKEAYNSTATSVSGSSTTVVNSLSITVKANSKVAVWFNSGQIQNTTVSANPNGNIQWVDTGGTVTNISDHNYNHTWWDSSDNIERQNLISQGISGALSAGTYTIRFLGGTYGGTTTFNFQSQGSHLIVQEIAAD